MDTIGLSVANFEHNFMTKKNVKWYDSVILFVKSETSSETVRKLEHTTSKNEQTVQNLVLPKSLQRQIASRSINKGKFRFYAPNWALKIQTEDAI